ncbi:phenylacetate--CoA ligase family protein [Dickeya chrysanthemi]|uniref:phenylacetate--CoA ligase family protein n=1 Tax=Dickeya chrysanthemi TaxID=556 RepID=UPI0018CF206E|nr:phenylacetate--CoA ligase family protein [Dickeya chrysanthemi]
MLKLSDLKISSQNSVLLASERLFSIQPFNLIKGFISAGIVYPLAERYEKRHVREKVFALRCYYKKHFSDRIIHARRSLVDTLEFAAKEVPYYRDLFATIRFRPESVTKDIRYLQDIPWLTKDIIREQGERLYSQKLSDIRHHMCKTGGSTGLSCHIAYDQLAADWSSAVTLYARESVGNTKWRSELHFACRFPDQADPGWPTIEHLKCFAMNRSNIFFDRLDDVGLFTIWKILKRRKPYMVHAHPSTVYALACYVEREFGSAKCFDVFESSGELLEPYMRDKISRILKCRVVDRYGLAELGVMAYEFSAQNRGLRVLDSEGWPESRISDTGENELVFTGFHNRLMPLIRYATGDLACVEQRDDGFYLTNVTGRIHDIIYLDGIAYPTHTIQDMLDHRVGGIQEFQIDTRGEKPILRIVPEPQADLTNIVSKIEGYWPGAMVVEFVGHDDFIRVGHRAKFRHVVTE